MPPAEEGAIALFPAQGPGWEGPPGSRVGTPLRCVRGAVTTEHHAKKNKKHPGESLKSSLPSICGRGGTEVGGAQRGGLTARRASPHRPRRPLPPRVGSRRFPRPEQTGHRATSPPGRRTPFPLGAELREVTVQPPGGDGNGRQSSPKPAKSFCSVLPWGKWSVKFSPAGRGLRPPLPRPSRLLLPSPRAGARSPAAGAWRSPARHLPPEGIYDTDGN